MSTASIKRRLIAGFGATTFGRFSLVLTQIVSVPIFLTHWGVHLYGEWILLNAIPTYFGLSDVGFGSVAGNEMTMLAAAQKLDEALTVFQSVWVLTTVISSSIGLLLIGAIWWVPLAAWLHVTALSERDVRLIILLLGISILVGMQETLFQSAFRCVGKYPLGTLAKSFVVLGAFVSTMAGVLFGLSPVPVTILYVSANIVGVFALWILLRKEVPWIRFGIQHARWAAIRELANPAISFMGFPLVNALNLQGILVVVGSVMGPVAVVSFNTARTISRTAAQGMNLINTSVWPEMSAAFGGGDMDLARKLHRRACQISIVLCVGIIAGIVLFGNWIWRVWTVGRVPTDPVLLYLMLLQMLVSAFWFTSAVVPLAINKHQRTAAVMLAATAFSLPLAWGLMHVGWLGLRGAVLGLMAGDVITACFVLRESLRLLDDDLKAFLASMFDLSLLRHLNPRRKRPLPVETES